MPDITALNATTATGRFVQTSTANGVTFGSTGGFNKWSSTAAQSLELWHDLSRRGVPSRLVIYSGEGHGPRSREHIMDRIDRTAAWFQHYFQ